MHLSQWGRNKHLEPVGRLSRCASAEEGGQRRAQLRGNLRVCFCVQGVKQAALNSLWEESCWVPLSQMSQCKRGCPA